jgi:uncharacterized phage protein (TIGR01671 family)
MIPKFRFFGRVADGEMRMVMAEAIDFKGGFVYYSYHDYTVEGDDNVYGDTISFENCALMQSTGLLDINDKEIFENDIVEWEHKDTGQLVRGIVKYDTELGFWGMTDVRFNNLTAIGYLANQRVTVLGNICENKELLEEL